MTERGRRWLAAPVLGLLDRSIRGSMTVGAVDEISLGRVTVRGLRFVAPDGSEVLNIPHLTFAPDPWRLLFSRTLAISNAQVPEARLRLTQRPNERLGIELAFATSNRSGDAPSLRIDIANVRFEKLDAIWQLPATPAFSMTNISGILRVRMTDEGKPVVRFDRLHGHAELAGLLGFLPPLNVQHAEGRIRCGARALARFELQTTLSGAPLGFTLEIDEPLGQALKARILIREAPRASAFVSLVQALDALSGNLSVVGCARTVGVEGCASRSAHSVSDPN